MRRLPAPIRGLLWSLGLLYAAYLIAGNVFLNSPLARAAFNRKPQTVQLHWSWAWTAWPGRIVVHSLRVNGHSHRTLWAVRGERASGSILLLRLLRRELHFGPVHADSVMVEVSQTDVDHPPPPWHPRAWRVVFDGIQTRSLQRACLGRLVIEGQGVGQASFVHQLRGGPTRILPSRMVITDARIAFDGKPLLHDGRLDLRLAVDSFSHGHPAGWRKAQRATGRAIVEGATPPLVLQAGLPVVPAAAGGRLNVDLAFDHGMLSPGGRLQWDGALATGDATGVSMHQAHAGLAVGADDISLRARALPAAAPGAPGAADRLDARLQVASRRVLPLRPLAEVAKLASGSSRFHWRVAALDGWTAPIFQGHWLTLNGSGDVNGSLRMASGTLLPGSRVEASHATLRARVLDNVFSGEAHALASVVDGGDAGLQVAITADRFTLAPDSGADYLRGRTLRLDMHASPDLARFRDELAARLQFDNADIPDLRTWNRYLPGRSLRFLGGSGTMGTDIHVDGRGHVGNARMRVAGHHVRLALGPSRLAGNLQMDTQLTRATRANHAYDVDRMKLRLDSVHLEGADDPPWWARLAMEQGRLDWGRPMRLRGHATMEMKDVGLLLSLFAERGAFPKWITHVVDDGATTAYAQVDARHGDFIIDQLVASNDRVDLFAHLRVRDGKPDGDFYVRWGVLGLGVALADGERQFHLLHARRWYQSQPNLLSPMAASP